MPRPDDSPSGRRTPIDPLLLSQTAISKRPAEDVEVISEDSGVDGGAGGRKRVRLSSDQAKLSWYGSVSTTLAGWYGIMKSWKTRKRQEIFETELST